MSAQKAYLVSSYQHVKDLPSENHKDTSRRTIGYRWLLRVRKCWCESMRTTSLQLPVERHNQREW
ncbi:MAG: hypothetical protein K2J63_00840 [Muribaculaceae bacterium]|nr:hypothetical protein [Muribaculaceae bacterium]MDE6793835.1 hypothetical protein [Muribaculaceae bacterium]